MAAAMLASVISPFSPAMALTEDENVIVSFDFNDSSKQWKYWDSYYNLSFGDSGDEGYGASYAKLNAATKEETGMTKKFSEKVSEGKITVSYDIKVTDTSANYVRNSLVIQGENSEGTAISGQSEWIMYISSASGFVIGPPKGSNWQAQYKIMDIAEDTWQHIDVEIDMDNKKFRYFVNGATVNWGDFTMSGITGKEFASVTGIQLLCNRQASTAGADTDDKNVMYIDNLAAVKQTGTYKASATLASNASYVDIDFDETVPAIYAEDVASKLTLTGADGTTATVTKTVRFGNTLRAYLDNLSATTYTVGGIDTTSSFGNTLANAITFTVPDTFAGISLSGSKFYQMISADSAYPQTFEFWIKVPETVTSGWFFTNNVNYSKYFALEVENGYVKITDLSATSWGRYYTITEEAAKINTGKWTHVTVTRDPNQTGNGTTTLYVNGEKVWSKDYLAYKDAETEAAKWLLGGEKVSNYSKSLECTIGDAALWSDVRTPDEIKADMTGVTDTDEGLMHHYTFDSDTFERDEVNRKYVYTDSVTNGISVGTNGGYFTEYKYNGEYANSNTGISIADTGKLVVSNQFDEIPATYEAWVWLPATYQNQYGGVLMGTCDNQSSGNGKHTTIDIPAGQGGGAQLFFKSDRDVDGSYLISKDSEGNPVTDAIDGLPVRTAGQGRYGKSGSLTLGDWVHFAVVLREATFNEDGTLKTEAGYEYFVNGKSTGGWSHEQLRKYMRIPADYKLMIGGDYRREDVSFKGRISEIKLWSTERTAEEIKADMMSGLPSDTTGLIASWDFNQTTEDGEYKDLSENGNNAKPYVEWVNQELYDGDYRIAVIPDTQYLVQNNPEKYLEYMRWIRDNADELNIKFAIGVGDIVDDNLDESTQWAGPTTDWTWNEPTQWQWEWATKGIEVLEEKIPYRFVMGNHDIDMYTKDDTYLNKYMPYSKYSQIRGFGGAMEEGKVNNMYWYDYIDGVKYMTLCLEFGPEEDVLKWAQKIIEDNSDCTVFVVTHGYLAYDGTVTADDTISRNSSYNAAYGNGDDVWNAIKNYKNVAAVLCGHIETDDVIVSSNVGTNGNKVWQILADAQLEDMSENPAGMLMLMTFNSENDNVGVDYVSPIRSTEGNIVSYRDNHFELDFNITDMTEGEIEVYGDNAYIHTLDADNGKSAVAILAEYENDGRLKKIVTLQSVTSLSSATPVKLNLSTVGDSKYKVFMFDSLENSKPFVPVYVN